MTEETTLARWAAKHGFRHYGTAGAVVAGAAAGGFVGYRLAKRRTGVRDAPDERTGVDTYGAVKTALDLAERVGDERGGRNVGRTDRVDPVRPGEGTDVPIDGTAADGDDHVDSAVGTDVPIDGDGEE
ncbi:hypothetical protein ACFO0N_12260 [Halobium salinum]|uniref:Uncharacterized protein n=1 Tax=Halobium salinum TaxID=1364940 RepID=A0ABD5PCX5_9EURY|nr:hypothetical protein [Halobium salinum]